MSTGRNFLHVEVAALGWCYRALFLCQDSPQQQPQRYHSQHSWKRRESEDIVRAVVTFDLELGSGAITVMQKMIQLVGSAVPWK